MIKYPATGQTANHTNNEGLVHLMHAIPLSHLPLAEVLPIKYLTSGAIIRVLLGSNVLSQCTLKSAQDLSS
jgi:hypothetical protein